MEKKSSRVWQIIGEVRDCNPMFIGTTGSPSTPLEAIKKLEALLTELDEYEPCEELACFCEDIMSIMDELAKKDVDQG